jgi:hypothetical protein
MLDETIHFLNPSFKLQWVHLSCRKKKRLGVFDSRVLRGICETKEEKVRRGWAKLLIKEHNNLHSSLSFVKGSKSRII